ncbi:MAG: tRNA threonylcarbamoyladenosine dehydratase [Verrucomicrobiota bacterium]
MNRFCRIEQLLGRPALAKLKNARVAVFGLGAVGSYAVEALARAGVGYLRLVDCDVVRPSNFNRQLYALESTLNHPKAEVARTRVLDINSACTVEAHQAFVDGSTAQVLLTPPLDVVVDAIDGVTPKVALIAMAVRAGLKVVASMGAATRLDPSKIRVGDIAATDVCPLAKFVRKKLKAVGIVRGVRCIYSIEPPRNTTLLVADEPETFVKGRPRKPIGSLSYATGMFGLLAAYETIKMIVPLGGDV